MPLKWKLFENCSVSNRYLYLLDLYVAEGSPMCFPHCFECGFPIPNTCASQALPCSAKELGIWLVVLVVLVTVVLGVWIFSISGSRVPGMKIRGMSGDGSDSATLALVLCVVVTTLAAVVLVTGGPVGGKGCCAATGTSFESAVPSVCLGGASCSQGVDFLAPFWSFWYPGVASGTSSICIKLAQWPQIVAAIKHETR